jgi:hypothetical protein
MKIVNFPDVNLFDKDFTENNLCAILSLYKYLGWDGKTTLNPSKIKINNNDYKKLLDKLDEQFPGEPLATAGLMINYAPSVDNIPEGKIKVLKGAF